MACWRTELIKLVRPLTPFLALPGLVLLGLSVMLGPDVWSALYASIVGFCRAHIANVSPGRVALGLTLLLALLALASGGFAALREWRRLKLLSRAIAVQSPHAVASGASEDHTLIVVRDDRPFAFCHGMLRPRIYYSTELARLLTDAELKAVLLHEKLHARRRDPLRVFMAHTLAAMFFFFPLVRVMRERYLVWLEVSADQEVVRHLGVAVLARALLKLLQPSSPLQVKAAVSQINPTEERIRRLTSPDASVPGPIILRRHSLATLALTAGTGFMAVGIVNSVSALLLSMQFCQIPMA